MIALSAPFWSIQADRRGPKTMMTVVLSAVSCCILASAFTQAPWQLLILRTIQGLVGGFVPIGLSIVVSVTPEEKTSWSMGYFQAAMVVGIMVGPLIGGLLPIPSGTACHFSSLVPCLFYACWQSAFSCRKFTAKGLRRKRVPPGGRLSIS